jgi:predicted HAD superfamily Cof-like phosphohydrolase
MSKVFSDVHVFMHSAGQDVPPFNANRSDQSDLYMKLIQEEYTELMDAEAVSDDAEICDACFDLMWVLVGYMKSRGWDCEEIWDEGAQSNLSKIDPVTLRVKRREDGKILKPEGWKPPDMSKFTRKDLP